MIHFVGAGPGAPDLITQRGAALLQRAGCVIYAGSLVNPALLGLAPEGCRIYNSAEMSLPEVLQAMQRPADKIAFGFQSSGGHRDVDKVVSAHVGVDMTIGGATAPLSGVFRYRVKTAFEGAKYKLTFVSDMDGWLKCHLALILPACYLCYACSGDLSKATKEQRGLVLDAAWEACEMLKAAHIPVDDKENTDCYRAGTPGRRKMDAMVLALCKTPLGRLCVSDHAMHAVAEMQYLDEAFEGLRTRTSVRMTAWDTLRSQMPSWDIMRKKTAKVRR